MKTTTAPANAWEVRMRWGDRALEAEVIDGRGKKFVSLGEKPEDTFVIAHGANMKFTWSDSGLDVEFSLGITGTVSLQGAAPTSVGQLIERGVIKEVNGVYVFSVKPGDAMEFHVAGQTIQVQQTKGRIARLELDLTATLFLFGGLALLVAWIIATFSGMTGLHLMD